MILLRLLTWSKILETVTSGGHQYRLVRTENFGGLCNPSYSDFDTLVGDVIVIKK
ncbi:hypothetical protein WN55_00446 [Dufourea novaeangliae]|uniref:Uncharacterized protein n=1 Tax=Dufourea novaeangliae TaxID=178035 RepID=A0A154PEZ6_DUFNO|nr:hypothetical protein WN55_00446 [Dufourea novaeangliae]